MLPIELINDILYKYNGLEHPIAKIIKNTNTITLCYTTNDSDIDSEDEEFNYYNTKICRMPHLINTITNKTVAFFN